MPQSPLALIATALVLLLLSACAEDQANSAATRSAASSPSPAAGATSPGAPPGLTPATVTRVVDGDTIEVQIGGQEYKLRYIGINTPETVDPRRPVECFGKEASNRNRDLVDGRTVGLEKDVSETDKFGRLLRYVWLGGDMVNALLVRDGYAVASTYPPDVRYAGLFASLQAEARGGARGLWGPACQETPAETTAPAAACDYSGTSEPVIKGNINTTTGEKIYHVPGSALYDKTVIDESKGERWFCTEADAVAAGWRRSGSYALIAPELLFRPRISRAALLVTTL